MTNFVMDFQEDLFILGAGFFKAISKKIPLMSDLADSLRVLME